MKRFHFSLERVREWRRLQLETEEEKLEQMVRERQSLTKEGESLEQCRTEAESGVWAGGATDAGQLRALDDFRLYIGSEQRKLNQRMTACDLRIVEQRAHVIEERRRATLLDRLRDRRHAEWQKEFDKELEALAAESYLAGWVRTKVSEEQARRPAAR
jgi:flagellar biosynthesis chaperone FliJ